MSIQPCDNQDQSIIIRCVQIGEYKFVYAVWAARNNIGNGGNRMRLGAAEALRPKTTVDFFETQSEIDRIEKAVQSYLDEEAFDAAYAKGLAMTREEAIAYALSEEIS